MFCPESNVFYWYVIKLYRFSKATQSDTMPVKNPGFVCSTCDQTFGFKHNLKRHIQLVHNKDRNFDCKQCDKRYSRKDRLLFHIASVHNGNDSKYFRCKVCSRLYPELHHLKCHIRKHHSNISTGI